MADSFPISFGRYEILERLAVGGMAELFRAHAPAGELDGELALKRLLPHLSVDPYYRAMFLDEAKLTSRMSHHNIIQTYDYGEHEGQLYMVMELVDGLDGLSILRECARRKVRMPAEIAVHVTHEVLSALAFAHGQTDDNGQSLGVVHRDISPANVLFDRTGTVKLADFGIAHAAQHEHRTKDGTLKGKYGYMSPEQVNGDPVDARSDVFSAAVLMSEMLMGRRLFAASSELDVLLMVRDATLDRLDKYGDHIGGDLDRIVRKALRREAGDRFSTAASFRDALAEWMYMHQHEIDDVDIADLVNMLYDDAVARKRERTALQARELTSRSPISGDTLPGLLSRVTTDAERGAGIARIALTTRSVHEPTPTAAVSPLALDTTLEVPRPALAPDISRPPRAAGAPGTLSNQAIELPESVAPPLSDAPHRDTANTAHDTPAHDTLPTPMVAAGDLAVQLASRITMVPSRDPLLSPSVDFDDSEISEVREQPILTTRKSLTTDVGQVDGARQTPLGEVAAEPDEVGDFAQLSAISLFYRLARTRVTGLLVVQQDAVCKEIYIRRGVPEYVVSNLPSELFGAYLVERGAIEPGELIMALSMQSHYGDKLGETLVGIGLLQSLDVFRYLNHQLRDKVVDVCTWEIGSYRWYLGLENPRPPFPLALNAYEVLGRSVRKMSEARVHDWLEHVRGYRPTHVGEPELSLEIFGLGRSVRRVYQQLDGSRSVAQYQAAVKPSDHTSWLRVLYLLVSTGLIQWSDGPTQA